ncbi:MAG: hypothetical protein AABZ31_11755, partial [Bdellovibrionota bacterium]
KVASSFALECTKCGFERFHRVLTHVDSRTAKVECEICKAKKTYKLDEGGKVAKKPSVKKAKKDVAPTGNDSYLKAKEKLGEGKPRPYRMADAYAVDMLIAHPKFGEGYVITSLAEKIEVAFEDANRALVQNRK